LPSTWPNASTPFGPDGSSAARVLRGLVKTNVSADGTRFAASRLSERLDPHALSHPAARCTKSYRRIAGYFAKFHLSSWSAKEIIIDSEGAGGLQQRTSNAACADLQDTRAIPRSKKSAGTMHRPRWRPLLHRDLLPTASCMSCSPAAESEIVWCPSTGILCTEKACDMKGRWCEEPSFWARGSTRRAALCPVTTKSC
jgi:hypothetical protein